MTDASPFAGWPIGDPWAIYSAPEKEWALNGPLSVITDDRTAPRAALRHAIDRAIASDHGPFAQARAAALRSLDEDRAIPILTPAGAMAELLRYEEARGDARTARPEARAAAVEALGELVVAVYERERALPAVGWGR